MYAKPAQKDRLSKRRGTFFPMWRGCQLLYEVIRDPVNTLLKLRLINLQRNLGRGDQLRGGYGRVKRSRVRLASATP